MANLGNVVPDAQGDCGTGVRADQRVAWFRRFLLRGLQKVRAEWKLICLTHNLLKLFRSGRGLQMP